MQYVCWIAKYARLAFMLLINALFFLSSPLLGAGSCVLTDQDNGLKLIVQINHEIGDSPLIWFERPLQITIRNDSDTPIQIPEISSSKEIWPFVFQFKNLESGDTYNTHNNWRRASDSSTSTRLDLDEFPPRLAYLRSPEMRWPMQTLKPGKQLIFYISLNEGQIELPEPNIAEKYSFRAILKFPGDGYYFSNDPKMVVSSIPVEVVVRSAYKNTPQSNLIDGNTKRALEILKRDQYWIEHRDRQENTPLIVASEQNEIEVIDWLLQNGADVNAQNRKFKSALHVASTWEAFNTILTKGTNIDFDAGSSNETPLQRVSRKHVQVETAESKSHWKDIFDLLIKQGAYYDLTSAIWNNDLARAKSIYTERGKIPDQYSSYRALALAASIGAVEICEFLINECNVKVGGDIYSFGEPIIVAALEYPKIVKLLIDNGANTDARFGHVMNGFHPVEYNPTPLHVAASKGAPESVKLLLDAKSDLLAPLYKMSGGGLGGAFGGEFKHEERTAIEIAAVHRRFDNLVVMLNHEKFKQLEHGLKQEIVERCFVTAASLGSPADDDYPLMIEVFLNHGMNPETKTERGLTVMQHVSTWLKPSDPIPKNVQQTYSTLLQYGAEVDLYTAVAMHDELVLKKLIAENPKCVDDSCRNGYPALHYAIRANKKGIVKILIDAGADANIPSTSEFAHSNNETALHLVSKPGDLKESEQLDYADLLVDAGASVNAKMGNGDTPLHLAMLSRNRQLVRLFLKEGADPVAKNQDGQTPWDMCPLKNESKSRELKTLLDEYLKKQSHR